MAQQATDLFDALQASGRSFVVIAPNNDPGSDGIFHQIDALPSDRFRVLPSMRFAHFSELMKNAACLVGNSSAGVREAPFIGLPSLDIGTRQSNRGKASSIHFAKADENAKITAFLSDNWGQSIARDTGFGSGSAAQRFVKTLDDPAFWDGSLQKTFHDPD